MGSGIDICGVFPNVSYVGVSSCRWLTVGMFVEIDFIIVNLVWLFCYLGFHVVVWYFKDFIIRVNRLYLVILFVGQYSFEYWILFVHAS